MASSRARARPPRIAMAVAALTVVGCGSSADAGPGSGAEVAALAEPDEWSGMDCPAIEELTATTTLEGFLTDQPWVRLDPATGEADEMDAALDEVGEGIDPMEGVDLVALDAVPEPLEGRYDSLLAQPAHLRYAVEELRAGGSLRLQVDELPDGVALLSWIVTLRPTGEALVIGACAGNLIGWSRNVVAAGEATSPVEAVTMVVDAPDPAAAFASLASHQLPAAPPSTAPPAWRDQPAESRYWHTAPASELAAAGGFRVSLELVPPTEWLGADVLLCTRTVTAWSSCVSLADVRLMVEGSAVVDAVVEPGSPVEVWTMQPSEPWNGLSNLGSVDLGPPSPGAAALPTVELRSAVGPVSHAQIESGDPPPVELTVRGPTE